jgi:hypothetical protein
LRKISGLRIRAVELKIEPCVPRPASNDAIGGDLEEDIDDTDCIDPDVCEDVG